MFSLDLNDEFGQTRLFTRGRVFVPQFFSPGAIESAAYAWELSFGRGDVAGAERFEQVLDTVADDGASCAITFATNGVLSLSLLGAFNIRHGCVLQNLF